MLLRRSSPLNITLRQSLMSLSVLLCCSVNVTAQALPQPALLEKAKVLHCVQSEGAAKVALGAFWEIQDSTNNFPDEHLLKSETNTLHAATLDIVLDTLVTTAKRYPALRSQVERTMLQWNYCDVMQNGMLFDVKANGSDVERSRAPEASPIEWRGFKSLGFFGEVEGRFIPDLISSDQQSLRVDFEWFFHRIYREQCFPHPDTSDLFDRFEDVVNQKVSELPEADENAKYPYNWDDECIRPMPVPELKARAEVIPLVNIPVLKTQLKIVIAKLDVPVLKTSVLISEVAIPVPELKASVLISEVAMPIPELKSTVLISEVEQLIPELKTTVLITETPLEIPELKTLVELEVAKAEVPVLLTKLLIDKPKPKPAPKPKAKVVVNNGFGVLAPHAHGSTGGGGTGGGGGGVAPTHSHAPGEGHAPGVGHAAKVAVVKTPVVARQVVAAPRVVPAVRAVPVVQQVRAVPVIETPQAIIVDKNQPLLERLLGGLSGGNNILIVDKIQLTVNEYHGSVETAYSSSDVGTTQSIMPTSRPVVEEVKQFVKSQFVPAPSSRAYVDVPPQPVYKPAPIAKPQTIVASKPVEVVKPAPVKPVVIKPAVKKIFNDLLTVPKIESMVIVGAAPQPVVIKKQVRDLLAVPRLKTKIKLTANKPAKSRNRAKPKVKRAPARKRSNDGSSSLFIYQPYENGDKPKPGEKTVEQLLQEYAEYEERMAAKRAGKSVKKKELKTKGVVSNQPLSNLQKKPAYKAVEKPKLGSQTIEVAKLNTQIVVSNNSVTKTKKSDASKASKASKATKV